MSEITFVLLKPDAIERKLVREIISYFADYNIFPKLFDLQTATAEKITAHYAEHIKKFGIEFELESRIMFEGKAVIPIVLAGSNDIIQSVRNIVGATEPSKAEHGTIRGDLGKGDNYEKADLEHRLVANLIHASDSEMAVKREIGIWLPDFHFDSCEKEARQ
ncbi:nucleoside-diphosphate kinase [Caproicibacter sp. BJN0012]|uniref:nucleoside-diphosphate kinase n=1 Tax=Caproicibacter sp. BJN0012 TaxID=3110227 RepID=UPI002E12A4D9